MGCPDTGTGFTGVTDRMLRVSGVPQIWRGEGVRWGSGRVRPCSSLLGRRIVTLAPESKKPLLKTLNG